MVVFLKKKFFHIILLFIIGGLLGYIFETLVYLVKNGEFTNKNGLWVTPLKPIYGLGLILISLFYKLKNKDVISLFLLGFLLGSLYEYLASIFQEYILHTSTWNYSNMESNLNGRITLSYSCIWGIFSFLWLKYGINFYLKFYNKVIKYKIAYKIITIISIILLIDITFTSMVTKRYSERKRGIKSNTNIDRIIDKYINNASFEEKFPNLRVKS